MTESSDARLAEFGRQIDAMIASPEEAGAFEALVAEASLYELRRGKCNGSRHEVFGRFYSEALAALEAYPQHPEQGPVAPILLDYLRQAMRSYLAATEKHDTHDRRTALASAFLLTGTQGRPSWTDEQKMNALHAARGALSSASEEGRGPTRHEIAAAVRAAASELYGHDPHVNLDTERTQLRKAREFLRDEGVI